MLAATAVLAAVPAHFVLDLAPAAPPAAGSLSSSVAAAQLAARVLGAQASKSFSFNLTRAWARAAPCMPAPAAWFR